MKVRQGKGTQRKNPTNKKKSTDRSDRGVERLNLRGALSPDEVRVTLKYNETVTITSTVGAGASYLFRGNGPFDPNLTGTGAQPTGYDQWSAFFNNQRTLGSRIKLIVNSTAYGAGALMGFVLAALPGVTAISATTSLNDIKSQKYAKSGVTSFNQPPIKMLMNMSSSKIFGKSITAIEDDDSYGSAIGNVPAGQWIWQLAAIDFTAAASSSVTVNVEIDYDIVYWGRTILAQS